MAKPLKETPILTGKDAENFFQLRKAKKATAFTATQIASTNVEPGKPVQFTGTTEGD